MLPIPLKSLRAQGGGSSFYSKKIWGFCQETWGKKGLPGDKPVVEVPGGVPDNLMAGPLAEDPTAGPLAADLAAGPLTADPRPDRLAPFPSRTQAGQYRSLSLDSLTGTS